MNRNDIREYYASFGEREWARLENPGVGAIEYAVTCHALESYLPSDGRILDIGGGPGRYTIWLAKRGYRVVLADISPELLEIARLKIAETGVEAEVEEVVEADACDLSRWTDNAFDSVLSLGPFYHLQLKEERELGASELYRVLHPGGVVFAAFMPWYAFLRRTLYLPDEHHHLLQSEWLSNLLEEGVFNNSVPGRFTDGYGVRPGEIVPFFERQGFITEKVFALEGFTAGLETVLAQLAEEAPPFYRRVLRLVIDSADDPSIFGSSLHLLYVGYKPDIS